MDTLNLHKQRPLRTAVDLTEARLSYVMGQYDSAKRMLHNYEGEVKASPEKEALWFYVQNHVMCLIGKAVENEEPLGKYQHFVDTYHTDINRKTIRMFYYLLLICTRESRHMKAGPGRNNLWKKHGNIYDYHSNFVQDKSHDDAVNSMMNNAPDVSLGEYTQFLVDAFQFPKYDSGFGGKNWKKVAEPLRDFVHGIITAEMLMDTAFTLAHNNGPIFNKGMLYNSFNGQELNRILDIQRSGQIPQIIMHPIKVSNVVSQMVEYVRAFSKLCPDVRGKVNWKLVKNIQGWSYNAEVAQQNVEESGSEKIAAMKQAVASVKAQTEQEAVVEALKAAGDKLKKNSIEIVKGVYVAKSERSL